MILKKVVHLGILIHFLSWSQQKHKCLFWLLRVSDKLVDKLFDENYLMPYKTPVYLQKDSKLKNIGSVQPQTTQQMVTNTCRCRARAFEFMQIHYRKKWTLQFNTKTNWFRYDNIYINPTTLCIWKRSFWSMQTVNWEHGPQKSRNFGFWLVDTTTFCCALQPLRHLQVFTLMSLVSS